MCNSFMMEFSRNVRVGLMCTAGINTSLLSGFVRLPWTRGIFVCAFCQGSAESYWWFRQRQIAQLITTNANWKRPIENQKEILILVRIPRNTKSRFQKNPKIPEESQSGFWENPCKVSIFLWMQYFFKNFKIKSYRNLEMILSESQLGFSRIVILTSILF